MTGINIIFKKESLWKRSLNYKEMIGLVRTFSPLILLTTPHWLAEFMDLPCLEHKPNQESGKSM